MKNQYFGDVNDYLKYGLLRCIQAATGQPIGVHWMLTENDGSTDGELRQYLRDRDTWGGCDRELHDALSRLLEPQVLPHVDHARAWSLVPDAAYFAGLVPDDPHPRERQFQDATAALSHCPVLFLDPDNGVEVKSVGYGRKHSSKYVYWRELTALYARGHSLVVYQHYPRVSRGVFHDALADSFRAALGAREVAVFSTPRVAFVLALQEAHASHLPAIRSAVSARWGGRITQVGDAVSTSGGTP